MKIQESMARGAKLEGPDQGLFTELVYGVTRMKRLLDKRLQAFCDRPLEETEPAVRTTLRLGLYQALFLTRVPGYALTFESVTLVDLLGAGFAKGFVNAVLRTALTAKDEGKFPAPEEETWPLGERYSYPDWLMERWSKNLTAERLVQVLEAGNHPHPLYLQVPPGSREEVLKRLEKMEVKAVPLDWPLHTLKVQGAMGTLWDPTPDEAGAWTAQDWTFQAMLDLVPAPEGARVWDVCAAPGGKCAGLSWRVGPTGQVTATDSSPERLLALFENVRRLNLANVRVLEMEADKLPTPERFQTVWLDAPCSGTGVLSRRADLRWHLQPGDPARHGKEQLQLLEAAAQHVYPGGTLAYSTCSLESEENWDVVKAFLGAHPEYSPVPLTLPESVTETETREDGLWFWPTKDRDGGFLALFRRKA